MRAASEERLRSVPWRALRGLAAALDEPLAEVLRGASAERVVDRALRRLRTLDGPSRAAVAEAIFGVAVWRLRLAYQLGGGQPSPRLLLASLLRDLGGIPDAEEVLELPPGAVPPARPPPGALALRFSLPPWLAATLEAEAGPEAPALADALDAPGPLCLRPNTLRASPAELARRLASEGVATRPGRLVETALVVTSPRPNVYGLGAWQEGTFELQDEGSQLVGALVDAAPGEAVLDLCAGAGGKTLQLAAQVGRSGAVHATDVDGERLERLERRARRAGARDVVHLHGAAPPVGLRVHRALVDAPCSELGALRRGPDARFRAEPSRFAALPPLQLDLLARAAAHVRPGGRLVYATCTFRREEDERVALAFERAHPRFRRLRGLGGPAATPEGFVRTWPHHDGCDGFFAAVWTA